MDRSGDPGRHALANASTQLESVDTWHQYVANHDVWKVHSSKIQRFHAVVSRHNRKTHASETLSEDLEPTWIVIHQQDGFAALRHPESVAR